MAKMYPEDIEGCKEATEGEKKIFRFLKEVARPHKDFTCWYRPFIGDIGKEPDFIVLSKKFGLIVLEVKDWVSHQIISYDPHHFSILRSGKIEECDNPDRQVKGYVDALLDVLKKNPALLSDAPAYKGKMKIPIGRMVIFPNISRDEYVDRLLQEVIPLARVMLKEELDAGGAIFCDESGCKFLEKISAAFPFKSEGLTALEVEKVTRALWPEFKIDLPARQGTGRSHYKQEILALDELQARIARRLKSGHCVVKGPAGTGKTLILIHKCCQLHKYNPKLKILLVCFNIALVSYLKRLLHEKGVGTGDGGIHICHFYELCSQILEQEFSFEKEGSDFYELVKQETLAKVKSGKSGVGPFDVILVDEGQDFDDDMLKVILDLLKTNGDLIICLDPYQDLYTGRSSWKSLGIKASGRTYYLKNVYRNSVEIYEFTQRLIGQTPIQRKQLTFLPPDFDFHGEAPSILKFQNANAVEDFLVNDLKEVLQKGEYKRSEIAIIYDDKLYRLNHFSYDDRSFPKKIQARLESSGIPVVWISRDVRSKELFDITSDRVSLVSIHSSKGLDFDLVYLVGIDHIHPAEKMMQNLVSLVYVAMTRAKYRLVIPYVEETELISRMKGCLPI